MSGISSQGSGEHPYTDDDYMERRPDGGLSIVRQEPNVQLSDEALNRHRQSRHSVAREFVDLMVADFGEHITGQVLRHVQLMRSNPHQGHDIGTAITARDLVNIQGELAIWTRAKEERERNRPLQEEIFIGEGLGEVEFGNGAIDAMEDLFGRPFTQQELMGLAGIPDRCSLVVTPFDDLDSRRHLGCLEDSRGLKIEMFEDPGQPFRLIEMTLYRDNDGKLHIYQDNILVERETKPEASHLACCVFVKQVEMARHLGVKFIHNISVRADDSNGYYTFARCGGNALLRPSDQVVFCEDLDDHPPLQRDRTFLLEDDRPQYQALLQALDQPDKAFELVERYERETGVKFGLDGTVFIRTLGELARKPDLDVQDLIQTREGQALWRVFGFTIPLMFDLEGDLKMKHTFKTYTIPTSCFDCLEQW